MKAGLKLKFVVLLAILVVSFFISLAIGGGLSLSDVINAVLFSGEEHKRQIIWDIRIPRILFGIIVGAGLSVSGCVYQGILQNPLADPYTLGTASGAALGATFWIAVGSEIVASQMKIWTWLLPLFAFLGALFSTGLLYIIGGLRKFSIYGLILAGLVLSYLFSSCILLIFAVSQKMEIHVALLWLMGDLSSTNNSLLLIAMISVFIGILTILVLGKKIDVLTTGEEKAMSLGIMPTRTRKEAILIVSLIVGVCVSIAGVIGFVGIIIPHIMRQIVGPSHRLLIPASAIGGAIFLCLSDTLARVIIYPGELPVGVITGIVGGLFFVFMFFRTKWEMVG